MSNSPAAATEFRRHTSVDPLGDGCYRVRIDPSWWVIAGPNGGYVAALVVRAIQAEVADPSRLLRTVTMHFLRAPEAAEAEVEVTVERSGRSVTNVSARLVQHGRTIAVGLVALSMARPGALGFDETRGLPNLPDGSPVPPPEQVPVSPVDPERDVAMRQHYDTRWVLGDPLFAGGPDARARSGGWLRPVDAEPIDAAALVAMTDAWLPPIFCRVAEPLAVPTVELTMQLHRLPEAPLDHCFVLFTSPLVVEGHLVERGRIWDRQGHLLAESRQLALAI